MPDPVTTGSRIGPPANAAAQRSTSSTPAAALAALLGELAEVLSLLTDAQYAAKPVGPFDSSVGGHVRHCLDHARALLDGVGTGRIEYDARQRGTPIESDRRAAVEASRELRREVAALPAEVDGQTVLAAMAVSSDAPPVSLTTTVGRELAFVLSHTIHHNAIIAAMAGTLGAAVPERFGYAPSTIAFLDQGPCAR